jgi:hypothetical protein
VRLRPERSRPRRTQSSRQDHRTYRCGRRPVAAAGLLAKIRAPDRRERDEATASAPKLIGRSSPRSLRSRTSHACHLESVVDACACALGTPLLISRTRKTRTQTPRSELYFCDHALRINLSLTSDSPWRGWLLRVGPNHPCRHSTGGHSSADAAGLQRLNSAAGAASTATATQQCMFPFCSYLASVHPCRSQASELPPSARCPVGLGAATTSIRCGVQDGVYRCAKGARG